MDFDRVSAIYDREIVPIWGRPFSRLLMQYLPSQLTGSVLEVGCATGYLALDVAQRLDDSGRLIALERSMEMIELAFQRSEDVIRSGKVFFQHHPLTTFRFAEGVFDAVYSNLGLYYFDEPEALLLEMLRVLQPGAQAFFTLPMRGSFEELIRHIMSFSETWSEPELARQIGIHNLRYPTPQEALYLFQRAGFDDVSLHLMPFQMIFRDGEALVQSPFFRHHFLLEWRSHLQRMSFDRLIHELCDLLDILREGQELKLWVRAGCLVCTKPSSPPVAPILPPRYF